MSEEQKEERKYLSDNKMKKINWEKDHSPKNNNFIATILKAIGVITIIGGFIAGYEWGTITESTYGITSYDFNLWYALPYWIGSFVSGFMFIAFGEIISLLTKINNKFSQKED